MTNEETMIVMSSELQKYSIKIDKLENSMIDVKRKLDYQDEVLRDHISFIDEIKVKRQKRKEIRKTCLTVFLFGLLLLWFIVGLFGIPVLFNQIF